MIMVLAPFVPVGAPQYIRTSIILVGAFGFAAFRAIGLVGNSPVIGEITTERERGRFLSGNWIRNTAAQLISLSALILILRGTPQTWVFQLVIAVATLIGVYVGWVLSRIPETGAPRLSASKPFGEVLKLVIRRRRLRRLLFAWAAGFAAYTLVIPFAVITVKNGYGVSDYEALIFSLALLSGGMTASAVNRSVADVVGPRPLFIIYVIALAAVAAYWAVAPAVFLPILTGVTFFVAGYCKFGILSVSNLYFLNVSKPSDRVGSALILRIVSGATAGLISGFIGGSIIGTLGTMGYDGIDLYRMFFRIVLVIFLFIVPGVIRLDKLKEWSVGRTAVLIFQPWKAK